MLSIKINLGKLFSFLIILILISGLVVGTYLIVPKLLVKASKVRVTNISGRSATVSWVTDKKDSGVVYVSKKDSFLPFGIGSLKGYDDRDYAKAILESYSKALENKEEDLTDGSISNIEEKEISNIVVTQRGKYYTHHVTVQNLDENTTYFFRIGNGIKYWNINTVGSTVNDYDYPVVSSFTFKTYSDPEELKTPDTSYGRLLTLEKNEFDALVENGSTDAIIFIQAKKYDESSKSLILSSVTNSEGGWVIDKGGLRGEDGKIASYVEGEDIVDVNTQFEKEDSVITRRTIYGIDDSPMEDMLGYGDANIQEESGGIVEKIKNFFNELAYSTRVNAISDDELECRGAGFASSCEPNQGCYQSCYLPGTNTFARNKRIGDDCRPASCANVARGEVVCTGVGCSTFTVRTQTGTNTLCVPGDTTTPGCITPSTTPESSGSESPANPPTSGNTTNIFCCSADQNGDYTVYSGRVTNIACTSSGKQQCDCPDGKSFNSTTHVCESDTPTPPMGSGQCQSDTQAGPKINIISGGLEYSCNSKICVNGRYLTLSYSGPNGLNAQPERYCTATGNIKCSNRAANRDNRNKVVGNSSECCVTGYKCDKYGNVQSCADGYDPVMRNGVFASCVEHVTTPTVSTTSVEENSCFKYSLDDVVKVENGLIYIGLNPDPLYIPQVMGCITSQGAVEVAKGQIRNISIIMDLLEAVSSLESSGSTQEGDNDDANSDSQEQGQDNDNQSENENDNASDNVQGVTTSVLGANDSSEYINYFVEPGVYQITVDDKKYVYSVNTKDPSLLYIERNGTSGYQKPANIDSVKETEDLLVNVKSKEIKIDKISSGYELLLNKGYNIVSFNTFLTSDNKNPLMASELIKLANISKYPILYISYFEGGKWNSGLRVDSSNGEILGTDFPLTFGRGYVIKASYDLKITLPAKAIKEGIPVALSSGWNLIGINGYPNIYTASSLINSINEIPQLTADNVTWWPTSKGAYQSFQKSSGVEYGFDFPISNKLGYFVRISNFKPDNEENRSYIWNPGGSLNGKPGSN